MTAGWPRFGMAALALTSVGWGTAPPGCCVSNAAAAGGYTFSLSLCPQTLRGGMESWGNQVLLDHPPPTDPGIVLTLSSDNSAAKVPAQVTVPGGSRTQIFHIETLPVTVQTTVTLTLRYSGGSTTAVLVLEPVTTTIASNPAGRSIVVDGATVTAPRDFFWPPGSSHTVNATSPQSGASGTRHLFTSWSDGGAQSHSVTASYGSSTHTALFSTQYALATSVAPPGVGSTGVSPPSGDGYYNSGAAVQVTASPAAGYVFSGWSGDGSGSANPISMSMGGPRSVTANFTPTVGTAGLRFVAVTPCRVADTRLAAGPIGGPVMAGGSSRSFPIPQSACGIPSTAQAYSLNVTVVPRGGLSYLTLWPTGQTQPLVSTLNSLAGDVIANAAIVPAGTGGAVSVFVTNDTDVILDINGYFDASAGASFYPDTPCRVVDTRNPAGPFGGPYLSTGQSRNFAIPSSACSIPANATAYAMNYTVVPAGVLGYLTTWPAGQSMPVVSTLNSWKGKVLANAAVVPSGGGGAISVYASERTEVILDINGHFGPAGGTGELKFYPVTPCRVADTRKAAGAFGGPIVGAGSTRSFPVPQSACGIPATAKAYSVNVTVVPAAGLSYLTAWPAGSPQPLVSTLNSFDGSVVANAAIIPAGTNGGISIFVTDNTHVVLDINGYFQ